ncbi:MAG: hypothetical protein ACR2NL_03525 [Acidimicrobiia bacterium]
MIDLTSAKALISGGSTRIRHDITTGSAMDADGPAVAPAVLLTAEVTDAVKQVSGDRVLASMNREDLWVVTGFEADAAVIDALSPDQLELDELVDRVQDEGYRWKVVSPSDP